MIISPATPIVTAAVSAPVAAPLLQDEATVYIPGQGNLEVPDGWTTKYIPGQGTIAVPPSGQSTYFPGQGNVGGQQGQGGEFHYFPGQGNVWLPTGWHFAYRGPVLGNVAER